jgi:hypothetical protein
MNLWQKILVLSLVASKCNTATFFLDDIELLLVITCNNEMHDSFMVVGQFYFGSCWSAVSSFLALTQNFDSKCHSIFHVAFSSSIDVYLHEFVGWLPARACDKMWTSKKGWVGYCFASTEVLFPMTFWSSYTYFQCSGSSSKRFKVWEFFELCLNLDYADLPNYIFLNWTCYLSLKNHVIRKARKLCQYSVKHLHYNISYCLRHESISCTMELQFYHRHSVISYVYRNMASVRRASSTWQLVWGLVHCSNGFMVGVKLWYLLYILAQNLYFPYNGPNRV